MADSDFVMLKLFETYSSLRGKEPHEFVCQFWDCVVITSSDTDQKKGFEMQIESKKRYGELPLIDYHVLADPPDQKIGSGGSTFVALLYLKSTYGDSFSTMRVLLIHAGGYSQRLPSHSLCGKLFSCLPLSPSPDGMPWQMLDLKLASFLPLLKRMPPGIYVTASDDIVTYKLTGEDWHYKNAGFTALAHPSTLEVGSTHGVYVIGDENEDDAKTSYMSECCTVLQKPSVEEMRSAGAIRKRPESGEEYVFSDSSFFFDHTISAVLIDDFPKLKPFSCETDVYGDFLRPLGTKPSDSYLTENSVDHELTRIRRGLFRLLSPKQLTVLILQQSSFYHIGTLTELIFHWCKNETLSNELGLQRRTCSLLKPSTVYATNIQGVLMHSVVHSESNIGKQSILEYCHFEVPVTCTRTVISGCKVSKTHCGSTVTVPDDILLFTVAICIDGKNKWSCGALHFHDDVKRSSNKCRDVVFLGKKLDNIMKFLGKESCTGLFDATAKTFSLWNARLFPVADSMDWAFHLTLQMVQSVLSDGHECGTIYDGVRISLQDFLKTKSLKDMIEYRESLRETIIQS